MIWLGLIQFAKGHKYKKAVSRTSPFTRAGKQHKFKISEVEGWLRQGKNSLSTENEE